MRNIHLMCVCLVGAFLLSLFTGNIVFAQGQYQFERMWPTYRHPLDVYRPKDIAMDTQGNFYVLDTGNNRIKKFTSDGNLISMWGRLGTGRGEFNEPRGIAVDTDGTVYVADSMNHRIQKFTSAGEHLATWPENQERNDEGYLMAGTQDGWFDSPNGIAVDEDGIVYIADSGNDRIQKISPDGEFITKWGGYGFREGKFRMPVGIEAAPHGKIYVVDAGNRRVQRFHSDGKFIQAWGALVGPWGGVGSRFPGRFNFPWGITSDLEKNIYVSDAATQRIQKFNSNGDFILAWGQYGIGDDDLGEPSGLAIDSEGYLFVTENSSHQIKKFTRDGKFVSKWGGGGSDKGEFFMPRGVALDKDGNVYVTDSGNHRVQKFSDNGTFLLEWGSYGQGHGEFDEPWGIAVGPDGSIYVGEGESDRTIQKFTPDGEFILSWGTFGRGAGEFNQPTGLAADSRGNVYVTDSANRRIQKFDADGNFITEWGRLGVSNGNFAGPRDVAVDMYDHVYVADSDNNRIQEFTSDGRFVLKWGHCGTEDGQFGSPHGIAAGPYGFIYVSDTNNHRVQKFTPEGRFVSKFGLPGAAPGQVRSPYGLAVSREGKIYLADTDNHRVQVFSKDLSSSDNATSKAIIVAGGGPYPGNSLWDATQMNANFAYSALIAQGFTKDTIYYISADTDLDLDGNGFFDDVDADAANDNLEYTLTEWAAPAEDIVLYITDHGGEGTFKMSKTDILSASELNGWLDTLQEEISGTLTVVYDACQSGSFLGPNDGSRIVITSAAADEPAYFLDQGIVSFSFYFWGNIFSGTELHESFLLAKNAMGIGGYQTPQLDDNGNGIPNEKQDGDLAAGYYIGKGITTAGSIPIINAIVPPVTLSGDTQAEIWVEDIVTTGSIEKVWALIKAPEDEVPDAATPVEALPTIILQHDGTGRYAGTYSDFTEKGTYVITAFARDAAGTLSLPISTKFAQDKD